MRNGHGWGACQEILGSRFLARAITSPPPVRRASKELRRLCFLPIPQGVPLHRRDEPASEESADRPSERRQFEIVAAYPLESRQWPRRGKVAKFLRIQARTLWIPPRPNLQIAPASAPGSWRSEGGGSRHRACRAPMARRCPLH